MKIGGSSIRESLLSSAEDVLPHSSSPLGENFLWDAGVPKMPLLSLNDERDMQIAGDISNTEAYPETELVFSVLKRFGVL